MKRKRNTPRAKLIAKMDVLWSKVVKRKAGGKCALCPAPAVNSHHNIRRQNLRFRHDVDNGIALCFRHHRAGEESAHESPLAFAELFRLKCPEQAEWYDQAKLANNTLPPYKPSMDDLEEKKCELETMLADLGDF